MIGRAGPGPPDRQSLGYLAAVASGAALGLWLGGVGPVLEGLVYPALAALLYTMFLHVPVRELRAALRGGRFAASLLVVNFLLLPPLAWALTRALPDDPVLVLAVLMVLLVPCTDWAIAFAGLGGGSAARMAAATPMLLLVQMPALAAYLWLFMGSGVGELIEAGPFVEAFALVIAAPLLLAALTAHGAWRSGRVASAARVLRRLPVPMTALVLFLVVASQADVVRSAGRDVLAAVPAFIAFALLAVAIAAAVGRLAGLGAVERRTLVFSASTRNSFVVLPLALSLPAGADLAAAVVVTQSVVEVTLMAVLVSLVPARIVPRDSSLYGSRPRIPSPRGDSWTDRD